MPSALCAPHAFHSIYKGEEIVNRYRQPGQAAQGSLVGPLNLIPQPLKNDLKHIDEMGGSRARRRGLVLLPVFMLSALSALTLLYTITRLQEPDIGVTIIFNPFQLLPTDIEVVEGLEGGGPIVTVQSPPTLPACSVDQPAIDIVLPDGSLHAILWLTWLNATVDCSGTLACRM